MNFVENLTSVWDYFKSTAKPVILYGMGDGADKVIREFEKHNINISGVMASDDFVRGQSFHDFTVKKLSDFESELGDFDIALCFASQLEEVIQHIRDVAGRHTLLVPSVPVLGKNIFDKDFYEEHADDFFRAYSLLEDEQSRLVFECIVKFQYSGKIEYLSLCETPKSEAFKSILKLKDDESYLDLGAYRGDTIEEFLTYCGGEYDSITAFEPNGKNFAKLKEYCEGMDNINLWQLGSYSENTVLNFNNKAGRNCSISECGVPTKVAAVDSVLHKKRITYAKLDVEGAEKQTFIGMNEILKLFKPKLNVACYHRSEDLFSLILQLNKINPQYKFYLRHHPYIPHWDTNLYCI